MNPSNSPDNLYAFAVPIFHQKLGQLSHILSKAEEHATLHKISPDALLQARLFPDMFAFTRQVQVSCDNAKNGCARLAAAEFPRFEDTEKDFAQLQERIARTRAYLDTLTAAQFEGSASRPIEHVIPNYKTFHFANGYDYLTQWVTPNFYFHLNTAYAILRSNGVPLGKTDYLGPAAE